MMKKEIYRALSALLLAAMLSACSNEEIFAPDAPQPVGGAIELSVSAGDFVTDGAPDTRVTDNGNVTTFENGDRIGLIVLKDNGATLVADNLPYKYDGTSWAFDTGNGESKIAPYYDNVISNVTYIAYFPYSKEADNVKTPDELKSKFAPKPDQRSEADYRASDLLVWTSGAASVPQKKLDIALTHAYASISLSPEVKCTLDDGNSTAVSFIPSRISDVSFTVGNEIYYPFQVEDGSFYCILPAGTSGFVRWFYTFDGKTYGSSRDLSGGVTANTRYVRQETLNTGEYSLDKVQVGDFYCKNASSEVYLIPGDIASLSSEQQAVCLGIVLKVGKEADGDWKDDCDYKLKDGKTEMTTVRGYVLGLYDVNSGNTCMWGPFGTKVGTSRQNSTGFYGYRDTQTIKTYATNNDKTLKTDFPAAYYASDDYETRDNNKYAAPANTSGWFLPSGGQCQYWLNNRDLLLTQVKKASGDNGYSWKDGYWSSSEISEYGNWILDFKNNTMGNWFFKHLEYNVRPCLAF